ncbi:MAG TPA: MBL fold metallo-hydrolase [Streptosporangiaceae bacterium]|nr:MBL fold metallo-hydrolase [Streptosporangiaceae bacterium]
MLLTKFGHSCVRLEKNGARLVIDPGIWAGPDVLAEATAVLITHEHVDHFDAQAVRSALAADQGLRLWASESVAGQLAEFAGQVRAVHHGDSFDAAGFDVHVYGSEHALLDRAIPVVPNTGFGIDGEIFHPGDSFTVPEDKIPTLLVPVSAPWLKFSEVADYIRTVAPERGYWIHDALLNSKGANLLTNLLNLAPAAAGPASFLVPGTTIDL